MGVRPEIAGVVSIMASTPARLAFFISYVPGVLNSFLKAALGFLFPVILVISCR